jgi:serine protease Do
MGNVFMAQGTMSEITFAVPALQLRAAADQIIQNGRVARGCMGVYLNETVRKGQSGRVVVVSGLVPNSPASRSGIRNGDIILSLNGKEVHCRTSLLSALSHYRPNDMITLALERNDESVTVQLPLAPLADTLEQ